MAVERLTPSCGDERSVPVTQTERWSVALPSHVMRTREFAMFCAGRSRIDRETHRLHVSDGSPSAQGLLGDAL
jgi:hypothetical protein